MNDLVKGLFDCAENPPRSHCKGAEGGKEIESLLLKLDAYRKALEIYADKKNWDWGGTYIGPPDVAKEALSDE